jgi:hypothetical protein
MTEQDERCPDCGARLPPCDGLTHRYIGASPSCWALFSTLVNGGEPPLAPAPLNGLITDAYAAQHPGQPSPQAIQSVAVHLLTLYGVLVRGVAPGRAHWIRQRALRDGRPPKHDRFHWLTPPPFPGDLTVASIAGAPTAAARAEVAARYVRQVWARWGPAHEPTVARWYEAYVVPDRLRESAGRRR